MKRLNRIFCLLLLSAAFAACSDDDGPKTPTVEYDVISFEPAEGMLDAKEDVVMLRDLEIIGYVPGSFHNVLCAKGYMNEEDASGNYFDGLLFMTADKMIGFGSYFGDMSKDKYGPNDTWGGFVLSKNYSQTPSADGSLDYKENHFSAWTKSGANNTATFAIAYFNDYGEYDYNTPRIKFGGSREVGYIYMANATLTGQYKSSLSDYWFKVSVTGYLGGTKGKTVEQVLISGKSILSDWVKVDCSSLGAVDELRFSVSSNDMSGGYLNCPSFFCIDEIALVKQAK